MAELPGIKVFESAIALPADGLGLVTKHIGEAAQSFSMGATRTMESLELPGLPPIAQLLPMGNLPALPIQRKTVVSQQVSAVSAPMRRAVSAAYGED